MSSHELADSVPLVIRHKDYDSMVVMVPRVCMEVPGSIGREGGLKT